MRAQRSEPRSAGKTTPKTQAKRREPSGLDPTEGVRLQQRDALRETMIRIWLRPLFRPLFRPRGGEAASVYRLWCFLSEELGVGADAGQTKFVIHDFPDQQETGLHMAFHVTGPDADKRMWTTPFGKRIICLQQRNHHPRCGTVIGGR